MTIDEVLQNVNAVLGDISVKGREARKLANAMDAIESVIAAVQSAREETPNEDHNGQGTDV